MERYAAISCASLFHALFINMRKTKATLCIDCINPSETILCGTYGLPLNQRSASNEAILQMFAYFLQTFATIRLGRRQNRLYEIFSFSMSGVLENKSFFYRDTGRKPQKNFRTKKRRHQNDRSPHETTHAIRRLPHRQSPTVPHKHLSQRSQTGQAFSARQISWNRSIKTMAHRINAQCPVQTKSTHRLARA